MAYTRPVTNACESLGCKRNASLDVFDHNNKRQGKFCGWCAKFLVKRLSKKEAEYS